VDVEHRDAEARDVGRRAFDRVRDVVELGVDEDRTVRGDPPDRLRSRGPGELEADLQEPDVRAELARQRLGAVEVGEVERDGERVLRARDQDGTSARRMRPRRSAGDPSPFSFT
jgi:hypothetical protein